MGAFCPEEFVKGDFVWGGFCPRGDFVQGILFGGFVQGNLVLEPYTIWIKPYCHFQIVFEVSSIVFRLNLSFFVFVLVKP